MEVEQSNFVTHLIITVQLYFWLLCKVIGKSKERILCKLSKSEILQLYLITRVAMETTKKSNFTCQSKSFSSIFFTCQVSASELQPFSCHYLAKYIYSWSQTAKTVFSHLNYNVRSRRLEVMGSRKNGAREGNTPFTLPSSVSFARIFLSCAVTSKRLLRRLPYL